MVLEFQDGVLTLFDDNNDGGATGFGIMTNEPRFLWQTEAIRHLQWKMKRHTPARHDCVRTTTHMHAHMPCHTCTPPWSSACVVRQGAGGGGHAWHLVSR